MYNDTVTVVYDTHKVGDSKSQSYVNKFEASIGGAVQGKSLITVKPSKVAGASLTTNAFNKAVSAIRTKAKA